MELTKEQQEAIAKSRDEALIRGSQFEEMTKTKGWEMVMAYIQTQIRTYTNTALSPKFKTFEEYQYETGRIQGLRQLIGHIDGDLTTLGKFREEEHAKTSTTPTK